MYPAKERAGALVLGSLDAKMRNASRAKTALSFCGELNSSPLPARFRKYLNMVVTQSPLEPPRGLKHTLGGRARDVVKSRCSAGFRSKGGPLLQKNSTPVYIGVLGTRQRKN